MRLHDDDIYFSNTTCIVMGHFVSEQNKSNVCGSCRCALNVAANLKTKSILLSNFMEQIPACIPAITLASREVASIV